MKSILIIVGDPHSYGSGHWLRMRTLAIALKKRQRTVQLVQLAPQATLNVPLEFDIVLLDRRDTGFNPEVLKTDAMRIAIDNRGTGRDEAHRAIDILPHFEMTANEYTAALQQIILYPHLTLIECKSAQARITLHDSANEANAAADLKIPTARIDNHMFLQQLRSCKKPALYFGQSLFEAIYLGLDIQLYPLTDYHHKLSVDLCARLLLQNDLLTAVDGAGLTRMVQVVQQLQKI